MILARSPAYRQVLTDLAGTEVVIPDPTDAVATGSCLQAAAVSMEVSPLELASRWELDAGAVLAPSTDAVARTARAAFDQGVFEE